jgi:nucleotide-binding universal stress UspA family protein
MSTATQVLKSRQGLDFKNILFATDFSAASEHALSYALVIARRYHSELFVVHAIPPAPRDPISMETLPREMNRPYLEAEQRLEELGTRSNLEGTDHLLLGQGPVWNVLGSTIQREKIDLLILGTRGRGGLIKLAVGSAAEEVLRTVPCPVLTVGPHVPNAAPETINFGRILFATDFGPASTRAFPYALSLAENYQAKLVLMHTVPPMPTLDLGPANYAPSDYGAENFTKWQRFTREKSIERLKGLVPADADLACEPEFLAETDFLPEGILLTAAERRVDLIVMGANHASSTRVASHIPWARTHEVISRAQCPVLTVAQ